MFSGSHPFVEVTPDAILWDVVEEHLHEASFLFGIWRRSLHSPVFNLNQIVEGFEARLHAHIEGIVINGLPVIERLLYPELEEIRSPAKATLAAFVMLRSGAREQWYEVFDFLTNAREAEHCGAIVDAIALFDEPGIASALRLAFANARSPREKATLLEVFAATGLDPGELLVDCFGTGYDQLDVAALKAAGRAGRDDMVPAVEKHLASSASEVRDAAIEAGLFFGLPSAWAGCRQQATRQDESGARAMLRVALLGRREDHRVIFEQLERGVLRQSALWAAGFTGNIDAVDHCLRYLDSSNVRTSKLAAEAIGAITGFDRPTGLGFRLSPDDREELESGEGRRDEEPDDLDGTLLPRLTDDLPEMDPYQIVGWWDSKRGRFDERIRYLHGKPYTPGALVEELRGLPMRRRHPLAIELELRSGGRRRVSTTAFSEKQFRDLEQLSDLREEHFVNRFV